MGAALGEAGVSVKWRGMGGRQGAMGVKLRPLARIRHMRGVKVAWRSKGGMEKALCNRNGYDWGCERWGPLLVRLVFGQKGEAKGASRSDRVAIPPAGKRYVYVWGEGRLAIETRGNGGGTTPPTNTQIATVYFDQAKRLIQTRKNNRSKPNTHQQRKTPYNHINAHLKTNTYRLKRETNTRLKQ